MIRLFLQFEFDKIKKYFRTKRAAKLITSALFITVFLLVGVGIYHFFVSSFRYIIVGAEEDIRLALSLFLYEIFLAIVAVLVIVSAVISSLFNLFRGVTNNWILSSPKYALIPVFTLLRSTVSSLLPMIVLFLPALLALQKVYSFGFVGLSLCLISILLLLISLNAVTHAMVVVIAFVYYTVSKIFHFISYNFKGLVTIILCALISLFYFLWKIIKAVDLMSIFKGSEVSPFVSISNMASHFTYLPTHSFAMEIISWQVRQPDVAITYFSRITIITILSLLLWKVMIRFFYPVWQSLQDVGRNFRTGSFKTFFLGKGYQFSGNTLTILFKKEFLVSVRNYKDVMWFLFLISIWLLQITANVLLNHHVHSNEFDISPKIISLHITQYIIALYFISAFTLRFVFPSMSVEKKTKWILGSSPISFREVILGKLTFFIAAFVVLGLCMNCINTSILSLPLGNILYSTSLFVSTVVGIVVFGLSIGVLFPNYETDDAEAITTSVPGLFFTGGSLLYSALSGGILYLYLTKSMYYPFVMFIIFTISATIFSVYKIVTVQSLQFRNN